MLKNKNWGKVFLVWAIILFSALLLIEARYTWGSYEGKYTIYHSLHPEMGIWRIPNQKGIRYASCYAVEDIEINSLGMRAAEPNNSKVHKVAYFGDSMLEGVQVTQEDHFIYQLNKRDSLRDHLNFGMSSTGTAAQWAHFQHFSKQFDFEHVYLCFYPANDIRNNSLELETKANAGKRGYLPHFVKKEDHWELDRNFSPWGKRQWLRHSHLYRKLRLIIAQQSHPANASKKEKAIPYHDLEIYQEDYSPAWQEAIDATKYAIQQFADSCTAKGISFTVLMLPSLNELLSAEERAIYHPDYHDQLDWNKPYHLFAKYFDTQDIDYLDFYGLAREAIQEQSMNYPYLYLACDGHYGALGHQLLRELLQK